MQRPRKRVVVVSALGVVAIAGIVRLAAGAAEASPSQDEPTIKTTIESTSGHQLSPTPPGDPIVVPAEYLRDQARETMRLMRERAVEPTGGTR